MAASPAPIGRIPEHVTDAGRRSVEARAGRCRAAGGGTSTAERRARPRAHRGRDGVAHPAAGERLRDGRLCRARRRRRDGAREPHAHRRGRRRPSLRRHGRRGPGGAHLHRRRDPGRRRRGGDPGSHPPRRRQRRRRKAGRQGAQHPPEGHRLHGTPGAAAQGTAPQRPRPDAGSGHESPDTFRPPPAQGRSGRHRRRACTARRDARARRDRVLQRLFAVGPSSQ